MRACLTMKDVVLGRTKSLAEIETIHIIKKKQSEDNRPHA